MTISNTGEPVISLWLVKILLKKCQLEKIMLL
ncbi:hypothetical protein J2S08_000465 [Bacillus chungangensis]|uniref:Uncharacterized protein n=1 Tax=Bacillus chungangensis TaxID=587633 RepID=A0ABT9WNU1_9BACI|nr:hypothetical protein [Bacillus chungangensis]